MGRVGRLGGWTRPPFLRPASPTKSSGGSTPTGGPRTTSRSARSTCWTTRCCASRCAPEHVKPRLLGHWGTTPGLNFLYAHMNRVIRNWDLDAIYVTGPGPRRSGGSWPTPIWRAPTARSTRTSAGTRRACAGCSGSSPSPAASPATSRPRRRARSTRAASWATRWPTPTARRSTTRTCWCCCVVGDGEAETGPLAASWHSNKFLNPARDGAVLPILHLNGYKIANPTVPGPDPRRRAASHAGRLRLRGPLWSRATTRPTCTSRWPRPWTAWSREITEIQRRARDRRRPSRAPLADDRAAHPEGMDRSQGRRRAAGRGHLPLPPGAAGRGSRATPRTARSSRRWMRSYRPEELFDDDGRAGRRSWPRCRRRPTGG